MPAASCWDGDSLVCLPLDQAGDLGCTPISGRLLSAVYRKKDKRDNYRNAPAWQDDFRGESSDGERYLMPPDLINEDA
ncbi:hypothetical protein A1355_12415 [Methylomonas koyamae]|uniref:Uncharacterized protein n=1 Tax=Methylomonas koyamae TaxID=702114 RepID=A0A177N9K3_9GAMM|nr:hypothetical protein A1355_12415 [Methylomonas koyamae]